MTYYRRPNAYSSLLTWNIFYECNKKKDKRVVYYLLGGINNMIRVKYETNDIPCSVIHLQRKKDNIYVMKRINLHYTMEFLFNVYIPRTYFRWLPNDVCEIIQKMISYKHN